VKIEAHLCGNPLTGGGAFFSEKPLHVHSFSPLKLSSFEIDWKAWMPLTQMGFSIDLYISSLMLIESLELIIGEV